MVEAINNAQKDFQGDQTENNHHPYVYHAEFCEDQ